jgi:membrane-associated PAP2 superfamily phosphatase
MNRKTQSAMSPGRPKNAPGARLAVNTLLALAALLLWDYSGADIVVAHLAGNTGGFSLRDDWFLTTIAHDGVRRLSWVLMLGLAAAVWWPVGFMRQLTQYGRLELISLSLMAALVISILKSQSLTSCPWDLHEFGGVARHLSHWQLLPDGGAGRCFPAGHASHGFAFMAGFFVFRDVNARLARRWLAVALGAGFVLGLVQQWRGAHFMSHTLWTAWLCWVMLWGMDALWRKLEPHFMPPGAKAAP